DEVMENGNEGTDTVEQDFAMYWLPGNVENLVLNLGAVTGVGNGLDNCIIGNALDNELGGGDGNDVVRGGDGNDLMYGGAGNDILDGGAGYDMMLGGNGNDQFGRESGGEKVMEKGGERYGRGQEKI